MSAAYLNPRTGVDPASHAGTVEFDFRNDSGETLKTGNQVAIGFHIFDAETGTLIVDGQRVTPERDLKPGETAHIRIAFEIPPEDGRYQVIVSPMREGICWYYEQGWPFLLLECVTSGGRSSLERSRVATARTLRRERALRSIARALTYPLLTIWRNRGLIRVMVRRDILGRYRGSFGGTFWTIINPLLLMATYFFVFGVVLRSRFGEDQSRSGFALYFLAGMLPWLAFSEAAGRAPSVMLEHRNFVKKLVFAVETLPVNLVVSGLVSELFALVLYSIFVAGVRHSLPASLLWLPVLLLPQVMFTAGVAWFLAALGVFVRDLGQVIGFLLTLWFFLTPICYDARSLSPGAAALLSKNPIYVLVRGYRAVFLENQPPAFNSLWKLWLIAAVVFVLGHAWFYKLRKSFADLI